MRVKFYLKRPKAKAETAVYCLVNYAGNSLKIYTNESILPKNWNPKTNRAKNTPAFPEHPEFNERLNKINSSVQAAFINYRNAHDHAVPSPEIFKPIIDRTLKRGKFDHTFFSFFEEYINSLVNGEKINPRTKKPVKGTGFKGYQTTLNHLKSFDKIWKRKVGFDSIDLDFYDDFMRYLSTAPLSLSVNTRGSHIQRIKAVMNVAIDKELTTNTAFRKKGFTKISEDADTFYLNNDDLLLLKNLNLTNRPRLDRVRDIFLVGCYTGLRVSDYSVLSSKSIKDGYIRITQKKTGQPVIIPIHPIVKSIFEKYEGIPPIMSDVEINRCLKDIGKMIPEFNTPIGKEISKGETKIIKTHQRWQLFSSHLARRSFASNEYKAGTPTLTIMQITGHSSEKNLRKYLRITSDEHASILQKLWSEREAKLKSVN